MTGEKPVEPVDEQALKLWTYAQRAAIGLEMVVVDGCWPYVHLGCHLPEALVRELARVADGELEVYRYREKDGAERVRIAFTKRLSRSYVTGFGHRPATDSDASLPFYGVQS